MCQFYIETSLNLEDKKLSQISKELNCANIILIPKNDNTNNNRNNRSISLLPIVSKIFTEIFKQNTLKIHSSRQRKHGGFRR